MLNLSASSSRTSNSRSVSKILIESGPLAAARASAVLENVADHLGLGLSSAAIDAGVEAGSKSEMLARSDPARPPGEVHLAETDPLPAFGPGDREYLSECCRRYLHTSFGYDYSRW